MVFDARKFHHIRAMRDRAEQDVIAEAAKMGIFLTAAQACVLINAAMRIYGILLDGPDKKEEE